MTNNKMTSLQAVLAQYDGKEISLDTYARILTKCSRLVGHGLSASYFKRATTKGILTYEKIQKACNDAASFTGSFHPAVCQFNHKKPTKKVEEEDDAE